MKPVDVNHWPPVRLYSHAADIRPTIVIDTREQTALPIERLPVIRGTLQSGDYSIAGLEDLFSIERKSICDLAACCVGVSRARFEREMHRLRGFRFKRLVIVGTRSDIEQGHYRSNINPTSILNSLSAWQIRYDIPILFFSTPAEAARQVESWVFWHARELIENVNTLLHHADAEKGRLCDESS